jgi:glycosyltransferase involved in cell wall biosynthesis
VIAELAAAEIFALAPVVLPDGDRDGIPNVLLEAMAVGVPVVASAVSGIPEVVVDRVTGRLVPQGCPGNLAAVISELLTDASARQHLASEALRYVLAHTRWEHAIIPLRDLLRDRLDPSERGEAGELLSKIVG